MKELPFFKFHPSEWIAGDITLLNYETQGVYINTCCFYWSKGCTITKAMLERRLRTHKDILDSLIDEGVIKHDESDDSITINFLDEQFSELSDNHEKRVSAGRKGGCKTQAMLKQRSSKSQAGLKHLDKDKEEDKEEEASANRVHRLVSKRFGILSPIDAQSILALSNKVENFEAFESAFNTIFDSTDAKFRNPLSIAQKAFGESAAKPKPAKKGYFFGDPTT